MVRFGFFADLQIPKMRYIAELLAEAPCKPTPMALGLEAGMRRYWRAHSNMSRPTLMFS
jgi:hypothetical protein